MDNSRHSKHIDLSDLAAPFTRVSDAEGQALALAHYGIDGTVRRLATEKDDTFRLSTTDGRHYIFKVANPAEPDSEIAFQLGLLQHIEAVAPGLPVPRVISTASGAPHMAVTDSAGQVRQLRMLSYLEGTPLDSFGSNAVQREQIGAALAQLRLATAGYIHPASHRVIAWDVQNLSSLAHLLSNIDDPSQRHDLAAGLQRFADLEDRVQALRRQVLHNDFSKSNLVGNPDAGTSGFITGVIDFGDAVHTAIAIDVSTALLNQLPRNEGTLPDDDPLAHGRDVLRGYLRHAELNQEELQLIPHLVMARVVARALLSTSLARRFPENTTYLLRNTQQGWAQLAWFLARSPQQVSDALAVFA